MDIVQFVVDEPCDLCIYSVKTAQTIKFVYSQNNYNEKVFDADIDTPITGTISMDRS